VHLGVDRRQDGSSKWVMSGAILISHVLSQSSYGRCFVLRTGDELQSLSYKVASNLQRIPFREIQDLNRCCEVLVKKLQFSQVCHIYTYTDYLVLGKQKLFIGIKILNFVCQLVIGNWWYSLTIEH
jgi:hypothetical protein